MTATIPPLEALPAAMHRAEDGLPFVQMRDGTYLQLLQADVSAGLWVVRVRFPPGTTLPRHKHTGEVFAFTLAGSWKYLEYPEINTAGSYLYEPAGSVHTLHVPDANRGNTDVWFAIRGANLNLDDEDQVTDVVDAAAVLDAYLHRCEQEGYGRPNIMGAGSE